MPPTLQERLQDQPYQGYAYAYPHKTAYRYFEKPIPLSDLWHSEDKSKLYLYVRFARCDVASVICLQRPIQAARS